MKIIDINKMNKDIRILKHELDRKIEEGKYYEEELDYIKKQNLNLSSQIDSLQSSLKSHKWKILQGFLEPKGRERIIKETAESVSHKIKNIYIMDNFNFLHEPSTFTEKLEVEKKRKLISSKNYYEYLDVLKTINNEISLKILENKLTRRDLKYEKDRKDRLTKKYNDLFFIFKHLKNALTIDTEPMRNKQGDIVNRKITDRQKLEKCINILLHNI